MKQHIWQAVGMVAVAPLTFGFLTWLSWWTEQVAR